MVERVDAGPIVGVDMFAVPPDATVYRLEYLAHTALACLFWALAKELATRAEPLPPLAVTWSGRKTSRRAYARVCDIPLDISKKELDRRLRAFQAGDFGLTLHGYKFRLVHINDTASPALVSAPSRIVA
jgi:methionyl-tRNA formyltransferase